ncbi:MAG: beta-ketoacyl synthase N-terminal-like domain-containing protein [Leeuwenhoekiella sp.]
MQQSIAITAISTISAGGERPASPPIGGQGGTPCRSPHCLQFDKELKAWVGKLPNILLAKINNLRAENRNYQNLDPSVLYAIYVSRAAAQQAGWKKGAGFGVNIGSSRGATQLFEQHFSAFAKTGKAETLASPSTTLGNISSWVAQDLQNDGPDISHSITCSTALHAVLNGVAWLQSGMCDKFLVGGSEAPLTPFTIAQMQALKTYSRTDEQSEFPCRAFDLEKSENTMVLGEGAASVCLEKGEKSKAMAYITGIGYATEKLTHAVSISAEAECFQKSMRMAVKDAFGNRDGDGISADHNKISDGFDAERSQSAEMTQIDAIVMHAPGTMAGDTSEYAAIKKVFSETLPLLTTNKWKIGHTFGASGLLSLELAINMLQTQEFAEVPFLPLPSAGKAPQGNKKPIRNILVNAVGFGGNAVSILLRKA